MPVTNPPLLHTPLSPPHEVWDSFYQADHYHILGPKLGASSLTCYLAGPRGDVFTLQGNIFLSTSNCGEKLLSEVLNML
jgi:hypothetical protein